MFVKSLNLAKPLKLLSWGHSGRSLNSNVQSTYLDYLQPVCTIRTHNSMWKRSDNFVFNFHTFVNYRKRVKVSKVQSTTMLMFYVNPLTPNDPYRGRTAPLTSKSCILYIYSTNKSTKYFKQGIHSPFCPIQNAVCFIILTCLVPVLFTFYIQGELKLKKNNSGAKRLRNNRRNWLVCR